MKILVKTSGSALNLESAIEFSCKEIADAMQQEISGGNASENQVSAINQEFIDRHNIKAKYHSGTFISFSIADSALDEFETFNK